MRPMQSPPPAGAQQLRAPCLPRCPTITQRPRRHSTASRALRSRPAADAASQHEELLRQLLPLDDRGLRQWLREDGNRSRASLDFLAWLAAKLDAAGMAERQQLNTLGGKLTALREGTDATAAAEWLQALRDSPLPASPSGSGSGSASSTELQVRQRQAELARRRADEALSLAQLGLSHQKAADLGQEMQQRRADSVAQIIGRAPVELQQAEKGLSAAGAADRILAALLAIPDAEQRLATLPEAFTAPAPDAQESADEELLHTTPMRLLQAIGVASSRLQQGSDCGGGLPDAALALPGAVFMSGDELQAALEQLRAATFRCWEGASRAPPPA